MGRNNLLLSVSLALVTLVGISIYVHVKNNSVEKTELSQGLPKAPILDVIDSATTNEIISDPKRQDDPVVQNIQEDSPAASCLSACQIRIVELLNRGQDLTLADAVLILENAEVFAQILATKPIELASLLRWLQGDEDNDNNAHLAANAVMSALSDEDRLSASQVLLTHQDPVHRILGVKLAANGDTRTAEAAQAFHMLVSREANPRVLITLLNSIPTEYSIESYHPETIYTLDTLLGTPSSDYIQGSALVAKSKLVQYPLDATVDVKQALRSPSNTFRGYGLKAYVIMKERQFQNAHSMTQSGDDQEFQNLLNAMVSDPDLDAETRELAQRLVRDF